MQRISGDPIRVCSLAEASASADTWDRAMEKDGLPHYQGASLSAERSVQEEGCQSDPASAYPLGVESWEVLEPGYQQPGASVE